MTKPVTIRLGNKTFQLQEEHDFDWLKKLGIVFEVFNMGDVWGSRTSGTFRLMSPEEFILGAEIDECSNVYTMGLFAFALLGVKLDRSLEKWDAGKELYEVALKQ